VVLGVVRLVAFGERGFTSTGGGMSEEVSSQTAFCVKVSPDSL